MILEYCILSLEYYFDHRVLFSDIEYCFNLSTVFRYPVILSIENHCSMKQQQAMVHYMKTILGEKLHVTPPAKDETQMPSPTDLKRRILIKVV